MKTNFEDVVEFHQKFGLDQPSVPKILDDETFQYRLNFLKEEIHELEQAFEDKNLAEMSDALVDLCYVSHGTAYLMGIPFDKMWDEVQIANMSKKRAKNADESKRGTSLDVVKPDDWKPPCFRKILEDAGYKK